MTRENQGPSAAPPISAHMDPAAFDEDMALFGDGPIYRPIVVTPPPNVRRAQLARNLESGLTWVKGKMIAMTGAVSAHAPRSAAEGKVISLRPYRNAADLRAAFPLLADTPPESLAAAPGKMHAPDGHFKFEDYVEGSVLGGDAETRRLPPSPPATPVPEPVAAARTAARAEAASFQVDGQSLVALEHEVEAYAEALLRCLVSIECDAHAAQMQGELPKGRGFVSQWRAHGAAGLRYFRTLIAPDPYKATNRAVRALCRAHEQMALEMHRIATANADIAPQLDAQARLHRGCGPSHQAPVRERRLAAPPLLPILLKAVKALDHIELHYLMSQIERRNLAALEDKVAHAEHDADAGTRLASKSGGTDPAFDIGKWQEMLGLLKKVVWDEYNARYSGTPARELSALFEVLDLARKGDADALEKRLDRAEPFLKPVFDTLKQSLDAQTGRSGAASLRSSFNEARRHIGLGSDEGPRQTVRALTHAHINDVFLRVLRGIYVLHDLRGNNSYSEVFEKIGQHDPAFNEALFVFLEEGKKQVNIDVDGEPHRKVEGVAVQQALARLLTVWREWLIGKLGHEKVEALCRRAGTTPPAAVAQAPDPDIGGAPVVQAIREMRGPAVFDRVGWKKRLMHRLAFLAYPFRNARAKAAWRHAHCEWRLQQSIAAYMRLDPRSTERQIEAARNDSLRAFLWWCIEDERRHGKGSDPEVKLCFEMKMAVAQLSGPGAAAVYEAHEKWAGHGAATPDLRPARIALPANALRRAAFRLREWWRNPFVSADDLARMSGKLDARLFSPIMSSNYMQQLIEFDRFLRENTTLVHEFFAALLANDKEKRLALGRRLIGVYDLDVREGRIVKVLDNPVPVLTFLETALKWDAADLKEIDRKLTKYAITPHKMVEAMCGAGKTNGYESEMLGFVLKAVRREVRSVRHSEEGLAGMLLMHDADTAADAERRHGDDGGAGGNAAFAVSSSRRNAGPYLARSALRWSVIR
ncbi:hypothetical protein CAL29_24265 [Bordetella genomosp. 10]|uniref:Uncharacterized protein n=1 Tax=Bordetella genomosp. 10 TaxID=1416804 RepID=A0A261S151_9BORD|nr:hypothetical protein [Bordetella genomosp. 10]OZI31059.1 hypothetical protein CAL29_24265 [Bordetella genomosp. 10]